MVIYVDRLRKHGWNFCGGYVPSCHMLTEPGYEEELHALAARIGLKRSWLHRGRVPHYDLVASKRKAAIEAGALELDDVEMMQLVDRHRQRVH